MYFSIVIVAGLFLLFENYECIRMMKAVPGIPNVTYYDKNYIHSIVVNTRRNGRKSEYKVNMEFTTTVTFGTNLSTTAHFYEYLHNEYRPSFVEWHGNLCTLISQPLFGPILKRTGFNKCPVPAAKYRLKNMLFDEEFPNIFPFEKGKGELVFVLEPSKTMIFRGDVVLTFKQRVV